MATNFTSVEKMYILGKFDTYKIVLNSVTMYVPLDEANTDYQEIQQWIADGGTVIDNPPE
jgi:hypothetical protein|tara:strand:+ start:2728 stop:2907 length:180 start_codon:yes stop_codon:yes gene_type:complete